MRTEDISSYLLSNNYSERVYAGILGKIIGVYLGRPVEGWTYESIRKKFNIITDYPSKSLGLPLIVADDDISSSFVFARAVSDYGYITTNSMSRTWLNYVIENKTVFWWGGYGRSTEHTALINLKNGVLPPASGSASVVGDVVASQVGAQIFNDALTLYYPFQPQTAASAAVVAGSVSHDGIALDITRFLSALRAEAFTGCSITELVEKCRDYAQFELSQKIITDVLSLHDKHNDWLCARDILDEKYGYATQKGGAPASSNFAMTLLALVFGEDDFKHSLEIAATSALDTDSNAGVVGMINGVRLGLDAVTASGLREPVADRMLVVSADGGECVTDAVLETRKILAGARKLHKLEAPQTEPRFHFDFPGSVQGFTLCPYSNHSDLKLSWSPSGLLAETTSEGALSAPVFLDFTELAQNFSTPACPTLFPGQTVYMKCSGTAEIYLYALYQTRAGVVSREMALGRLTNEYATYSWEIPDVDLAVPFRFGLRIKDGKAVISSIDWSGSPRIWEFSGRLQSDIWDLAPVELKSWVTNCDIFEADFASTFVVSQAHSEGIAFIGTRSWDDYLVSARLFPSFNSQCGLVLRCTGLERFYSVILGGGALSIVLHNGITTETLTCTSFDYPPEEPVSLIAHVCDNKIHASAQNADGTKAVVQTTDSSYTCGAAGIYIYKGTVGVDNFKVEAI